MTQSLEPCNSRILWFCVQTKLEVGATCDGEALKHLSALGGTRKAHHLSAKVTVLNTYWWQAQDWKLFNCIYMKLKYLDEQLLHALWAEQSQTGLHRSNHQSSCIVLHIYRLKGHRGKFLIPKVKLTQAAQNSLKTRPESAGLSSNPSCSTAILWIKHFILSIPFFQGLPPDSSAKFSSTSPSMFI